MMFWKRGQAIFGKLLQYCGKGHLHDKARDFERRCGGSGGRWPRVFRVGPGWGKIVERLHATSNTVAERLLAGGRSARDLDLDAIRGDAAEAERGTLD